MNQVTEKYHELFELIQVECSKVSQDYCDRFIIYSLVAAGGAVFEKDGISTQVYSLPPPPVIILISILNNINLLKMKVREGGQTMMTSFFCS